MELSPFGVRATAGSLRQDTGLVLRHAWTADGVVATPVTNGAQLLHLSVALCVVNDTYREAAALGMEVRGVAVEADGAFDPAWRSTGITYAVSVDAPESEHDLARLLAIVDDVAEVPRSIRAGATVDRLQGRHQTRRVVDGPDEQLLVRLDRLRDIIEWKCSRLDPAGASRTVGASAITLAGLCKHLALVEDDYCTLRLHGRPLPAPWDEVEFGALADWAWSSAAGDSPDALVALWRAAVSRSRAAVEEAVTEGGFDRRAVLWPAEPAATVREILLDLIEEYARHCGHADLIRESVDGLVGEDPPR